MESKHFVLLFARAPWPLAGHHPAGLLCHGPLPRSRGKRLPSGCIGRIQAGPPLHKRRPKVTISFLHICVLIQVTQARIVDCDAHVPCFCRPFHWRLLLVLVQSEWPARSEPLLKTTSQYYTIRSAQSFLIVFWQMSPSRSHSLQWQPGWYSSLPRPERAKAKHDKDNGTILEPVALVGGWHSQPRLTMPVFEILSRYVHVAVWSWKSLPKNERKWKYAKVKVGGPGKLRWLPRQQTRLPHRIHAASQVAGTM